MLRRFRSHLAELWDDFRLRRAPLATRHLPLARFIYERNKFKAVVQPDGTRVYLAKFKAFEPKNSKISTYHTFGLERAEVWTLDPGRYFNRTRQMAIAVAHFLASAAFDLGMDVRQDDHPKRHVTIRPAAGMSYEFLDAVQKLADQAEVDLRPGS